MSDVHDAFKRYAKERSSPDTEQTNWQTNTPYGWFAAGWEHGVDGLTAALARAERDRDELELALQLTEPTYHRLTAELQEANERGDRLEAMCERLCCINVQEQMALRGKVQAAEQRAARLEAVTFERDAALLAAASQAEQIVSLKALARELLDMLHEWELEAPSWHERRKLMLRAQQALAAAPATPHGDGARDVWQALFDAVLPVLTQSQPARQSGFGATNWGRDVRLNGDQYEALNAAYRDAAALRGHPHGDGAREG